MSTREWLLDRPFWGEKTTVRVLQGASIVVLLIVFLSLPLVLQGRSLSTFYVSLFTATFGSPSGLTQTIIKATPVFLAGIGVLIAFRGGIWNIGSEGQIAVGAFGASAVVYSGLGIGTLPTILLAFVVAFVGGGLYALLAGVLKVWFDINEILSTLMLNFVALQLVAWGAQSVWRDPAGFPYSRRIPDGMGIPNLVGSVHVGVLVAVVAFVLAVVLLAKTKWGYEFSAIGADAEAARTSGIAVNRKVLLIFFVSGALAGLAGVIELLGVQGRLETGITGPNFGYLAIIAVLLGNERLRYLPVACLLIGALLAAQVSLSSAVSDGAELFVVGAILLSVLAFERINR